MYNVNITQTAKRDLANAVNYISGTLNNRQAANRLLEKTEQEISLLAEAPFRNPLVKDVFLSEYGVRIQLINKYLMFYVVRESSNSITILRIIHSRRDWISILNNDL